MKVTELIASHGKTGFSFEVLPPLKGKGIAQLFRNIDILKEFNPLFINITTHRSEMVYKNTPDGLYQKVSERSRPELWLWPQLYNRNTTYRPYPTLYAADFPKSKPNMP